MKLARISYTLQKGWQYREQLGQMKTRGIASVHDIDLEALKARGCTVLILDWDGVLSSHGKLALDEAICAFLDRAVEVFEDNVYVLSNNPKPDRADFLKARHPRVHFHTASRKKPHPNGLEEIAALTGQSFDQMVIVDDRLLTGCLAAAIVGMWALFINRPLADWRASPLKELIFAIARAAERFFFNFFSPQETP